MSIKLALLKSGDTLIAEAKEIVFEETKEIHSYYFENPHVITTRSKVMLTEEEREPSNDFELDVVLTPWIVLSKDNKMAVPKDWVVTIVDPLDQVKQMYIDKCNASLNIQTQEDE